MTSKSVLVVAIDPGPDQRKPNAQLLRQAAESAGQRLALKHLRLLLTLLQMLSNAT